VTTSPRPGVKFRSGRRKAPPRPLSEVVNSAVSVKSVWKESTLQALGTLWAWTPVHVWQTAGVAVVITTAPSPQRMAPPVFINGLPTANDKGRLTAIAAPVIPIRPSRSSQTNALKGLAFRSRPSGRIGRVQDR